MRIRTESKREEILEIAREVFVEMGFEASSMAEVAARVGGSKTTLYGYFRSKEQLFSAVLQHVSEKRALPILNALSERIDDEPREVLMEVGLRLNEMVTRPEMDALAKIAFSQLTKPEFAQSFWELGPGKMFQLLENYFQIQAKNGRLNVPNPKIAAEHILALYHAEIGPPFRPRPPVPPTRRFLTQVVTRAVDVFLAAYGPKD